MEWNLQFFRTVMECKFFREFFRQQNSELFLNQKHTRSRYFTLQHYNYQLGFHPIFLLFQSVSNNNFRAQFVLSTRKLVIIFSSTIQNNHKVLLVNAIAPLYYFNTIVVFYYIYIYNFKIDQPHYDMTCVEW